MTKIELTTDYGTIEVVPQSDLDLYLPGSELDFGAFRVRVSGHFQRKPTGRTGYLVSSWTPWAPHNGTWQVKRTDSARPTTSLMDEKVCGVVASAVSTIGEDTLAAVQAAARLEQARSRDALATDLRLLAHALEVEADALRMGGREEYHDHYHAAGFTETGIRHVRTRDGILLPSLPTVTVYASHKYGPRLPVQS